jgi:hypothetical protein
MPEYKIPVKDAVRDIGVAVGGSATGASGSPAVAKPVSVVGAWPTFDEPVKKDAGARAKLNTSIKAITGIGTGGGANTAQLEVVTML